MEKNVLDTNVLLHNPRSIFSFGANEVVIPLAVIEEIDGKKRLQNEIGRNAREVSRILDKMRALGRLADGVPLENGGTLRIEMNHQHCINFPDGLDPLKSDNRILAVAYNLAQQQDSDVTLVTKDLNLRIKADVIGLRAKDFSDQVVEYTNRYNGFAHLKLDRDELVVGDRFGLYPNQFVFDGEKLSRYVRGTLLPLKHATKEFWGITARNQEQQAAFELLADDSIKVVTLVGAAGTGKTMLALAVAFELITEKLRYARLLITRPVIPMGDDIGYLPGSKEEKYRPWMQPIYDNIEYIMRDIADRRDVVEDLKKRGMLEMEPLTYIRGRSIPNQIIICDEAQNMTPHMIKTMVTRVGEGTKIIFTGDPEQIDSPYLDASSNGLSHLVEKLKGEDFSGHVTLVKGERSFVAERCAQLL